MYLEKKNMKRIILFVFLCGLFLHINCQPCLDTMMIEEVDSIISARLDGVYGVIDDLALYITRASGQGMTDLMNVSDIYNLNGPIASVATNRNPNTLTISPDQSFAVVCSNGGNPLSNNNFFIINTTSPISTNFGIISQVHVLPQSRLAESWIDLANDRVYVSSSGGRGLIVMDISNLSNPIEIMSSTESFNGAGIECKYVEGETYPYCFISDASNERVKQYKIELNSVPLINDIGPFVRNNPFEIIMSKIHDAFVINFSGNSEIQIVDISDILNPIIGASFDLPNGNQPPPRGSSVSIQVKPETNQEYLFTVSRNGWFEGFCMTDNFTSAVLMSARDITPPTGTCRTMFIDRKLDQIAVYQPFRITALNTSFISYELDWCGSGIISAGEQCEYGSCCNTTDCQFSPSTQLCRAAEVFCDLNSYCSGTFEDCIRVYKSQGTECDPTKDQCKNGGVCAGVNDTCFPPINKIEGTPCILDDSTCAINECVGSICELIDNSACPKNTKLNETYASITQIPSSNDQLDNNKDVTIIAATLGSVLGAAVIVLFFLFVMLR